MSTRRTEASLLSMLNVLLARRRLILALILLGGVAGFLLGFLSQRTYTATAAFLPRGPETGAPADLALAASQLGLRIPTGSGAWTPAVYVDLVRSHGLLAPIVTDTMMRDASGGRS